MEEWERGIMVPDLFWIHLGSYSAAAFADTCNKLLAQHHLTCLIDIIWVIQRLGFLIIRYAYEILHCRLRIWSRLSLTCLDCILQYYHSFSELSKWCALTLNYLHTTTTRWKQLLAQHNIFSSPIIPFKHSTFSLCAEYSGLLLLHGGLLVMCSRQQFHTSHCWNGWQGKLESSISTWRGVKK